MVRALVGRVRIRGSRGGKDREFFFRIVSSRVKFPILPGFLEISVSFLESSAYVTVFPMAGFLDDGHNGRLAAKNLWINAWMLKQSRLGH